MTIALHRLPSAPPVDARALDRLHRAAPAIARAAVEEAADAGRVPEGLDHALQTAITQFLDPARHPETTALMLFHHLGAAAADHGMPLHDVDAAQQTAIGTAVQRLAEQALRLGVLARPDEAGLLARRAFAYADRLKDAATAGYNEASRPDPDPAQRRLITLLLRSSPTRLQLKQAAEQAGWTLPRTIAVVAFSPGPRRPARHLLPDVLAHPARGCLLVPDPDGPGRGAALERMLHAIPSALGPTVEPTRAAASLRLARHTLDLVATGVITASGPVPAMEHVPDLMIMNDPEPVRRLAERQLAPLAHHPPKKRAVHVQTLRTWFVCGFNTSATAERLHVHAQTVRYRIRQLELLFGPDLYDPDQSLNYMIALHAWTLMSSPDGHGIWQT
ncbi:helix-turn-helix domain-containing protein [Actinocorallia sp. B10E7]|uniref:PucR family transcriptional regulator n=1 Tax=Actinocorallia sp. B10E7 TaxID=3153558 RepID=UPI00325EC979